MNNNFEQIQQKQNFVCEWWLIVKSFLKQIFKVKGKYFEYSIAIEVKYSGYKIEISNSQTED